VSCVDRIDLTKRGLAAPSAGLCSSTRPLRAVAGVGLLLLMSACSDSPQRPGTGAPTSSATSTAAVAEQNQPRGGTTPPQPAEKQKPSAGLAPPKAPRNHDELRTQAAHRLIEANPQQSYMGKVPDILLAIPVLEVTLNRDGSIKRIVVLRQPKQALDTVQLAIDALHRAAPFGDLSRLPAPWKFNETFLFNDDRRFKPRTLD
jgi:hypothetical protein